MNNNKGFRAVYVGLVLFATSMSTHAILLGSGALNDNTVEISSGATESTGRLTFDSFWSIAPSAQATFTEILSAASIGTTFTYSSGDEFDVAAAILTDGFNSALLATPSTIAYWGYFEAVLFNDDPASLNGFDFEGYTISSIGWTIDSYSISTDSEGLTSAALSSSLSVFGDAVNGAGGATGIPEPSTLALMGLGLAGLGFARKRKAT